MTKHLLRWLCVFLCFPMLSGCWATWSELKKERLLREELEKQFRAFKREQRKERDKQKQIIKEKVLKQAALLAQMHAQQVQLKRKIAKLSTTVKRGQGGVVEVFATLQALQKKFESSIGKVTELQTQMTDLVNKQPDIMKSFQELQKRYEVLLTNQKALAEQAIPARLFSRAKDIYKAKKYDEAFKLFKTFTQRFAKHPLTDNALVYIGEIHIRKKQYNQAIGSFSDILENHADGSEVPVALFRLGTLHYKQGLCSQGRRYFRRLMRYRSRAATLAKEARNLYRNWRGLCKTKRRSRRRRRRRRR